MSKSARTAPQSHHLDAALAAFGAQPEPCRLISAVENWVYEAVRADGPFILRVTSAAHRSDSELRAEFEWIDVLAQAGVSVATSIRSLGGSRIVTIGMDPVPFHAAAFEQIAGQNLIEAGECTPERYRDWGRTMGRMHRLAKTFAPIHRRKSWSENDLLARADVYLAGQPEVLRKRDMLIADLSALPAGPDDFGLVHGDLSDMNFFIHDRGMTVFDFDDSEYHWFAYDIAVVLFDCLPWLPGEGYRDNPLETAFFRDFMVGYSLENELSMEMLSRIPQFMRLREVLLYVSFHKRWDMDNLSEDRRRMVGEYRRSILES